jgi:peptide/nickel transport system substrate-binding protein
MILKQATTVDTAERQALIEEIQDTVAADLSTVPLLQGAQLAVTGSSIEGLTLDASFKVRFAGLTKG